MESSNSSYFSNYSTNNNNNHNNYAEKGEEEVLKKSSYDKTFYSSLHSIRKPLIMKKPIAPLPPTKPKVYKVDPAKFKEVVQRLTAASPSQYPSSDHHHHSADQLIIQPRPQPRSHPRRLDEIAPPPLDLMISTTTTAAAGGGGRSTDRNSWSSSARINDHHLNNYMKKVVTPNKSHNNKYLESCGAGGSLSPLMEFNFSPSTAMIWPFSPLLSPGTMSSLENATVL